MAHRPSTNTPLSGAGTTVISKGPGVLVSITVTTAGTSITAYDNASAASGKELFGIGALTGTFPINTACAQGCTIAVVGSAVFTVNFRSRK